VNLLVPLPAEDREPGTSSGDCPKRAEAGREAMERRWYAVELDISKVVQYLRQLMEGLRIKETKTKVKEIFETDFGIPPDEVYTKDRSFYAVREFDWDEILAVCKDISELENYLLTEHEEFTQIILESQIPTVPKWEAGVLEPLRGEVIFYVSVNSRIILRIRSWDDDC